MLGGPYPAKLHAGVVEAIIIKTPVLATNKSREGGRGGETDHAHAHALDRLPQRQKDRQCQKERKETGKGRWVGKHTPNENKKRGDRKTSIHGIGQEERKSQMEGLKEKQKQRGGQMDERPICE